MTACTGQAQATLRARGWGAGVSGAPAQEGAISCVYVVGREQGEATVRDRSVLCARAMGAAEGVSRGEPGLRNLTPAAPGR